MLFQWDNVLMIHIYIQVYIIMTLRMRIWPVRGRYGRDPARSIVILPTPRRAHRAHLIRVPGGAVVLLGNVHREVLLPLRLVIHSPRLLHRALPPGLLLSLSLPLRSGRAAWFEIRRVQPTPILILSLSLSATPSPPRDPRHPRHPRGVRPADGGGGASLLLLLVLGPEFVAAVHGARPPRRRGRRRHAGARAAGRHEGRGGLAVDARRPAPAARAAAAVARRVGEEGGVAAVGGGGPRGLGRWVVGTAVASMTTTADGGGVGVGRGGVSVTKAGVSRLLVVLERELLLLVVVVVVGKVGGADGGHRRRVEGRGLSCGVAPLPGGAASPDVEEGREEEDEEHEERDAEAEAEFRPGG